MPTPFSISSSEKPTGYFTSGDNASHWFASVLKKEGLKSSSIYIGSVNLISSVIIDGINSAESGQSRSGETSIKIASINSAPADHNCELRNTLDQLLLKLAAGSHAAAIEWLESTIKQNNTNPCSIT